MNGGVSTGWVTARIETPMVSLDMPLPGACGDPLLSRLWLSRYMTEEAFVLLRKMVNSYLDACHDALVVRTVVSDARPSVKVVRVGDGWPEAVSDGLCLPCGVCGGNPVFDYTVRDEMWRDVAPEEKRLGVICLPCFDRLAAEVGKNVATGLQRVQFVGVGKTIILQPTICYEYDSARPTPEDPDD